MQSRALGAQGLTVSAEGLGCMGMSSNYGAFDDAENLATLHRALDLGVTLLDTADAYGPWTNERLLGQVLATRRDEVVLATKFGNELDDQGRRTGAVNGTPAYARASVDGSLQRLGTDVIDLYYQHRVDPAVPLEETFGALGELVTAGKVRYLGISEASPESIRRAHATHPLSAVQTEWSLFTRDVEDNGVLATVRELGIGFVPYSPLGRGFLSGKIRTVDDFAEDDVRRTSPRFQGRELRQEPAGAGPGRRDRRGQGPDPDPVGAGLGAGAGSGRRPHPGHPADRQPGGERLRPGRRADTGRPGRHRGGRPGRRRGRRPLRTLGHVPAAGLSTRPSGRRRLVGRRRVRRQPQLVAGGALVQQTPDCLDHQRNTRPRTGSTAVTCVRTGIKTCETTREETFLP
jgi:aryl-alcohol dehydrogenase-like predicted oxidoreductase